ISLRRFFARLRYLLSSVMRKTNAASAALVPYAWLLLLVPSAALISSNTISCPIILSSWDLILLNAVCSSFNVLCFTLSKVCLLKNNRGCSVDTDATQPVGAVSLSPLLSFSESLILSFLQDRSTKISIVANNLTPGLILIFSIIILK